MKEHIKILLIGDEGVGKSSLLTTFASGQFSSVVPPVTINMEIPPEKTSFQVFVSIMDSSSNPKDRETVKSQILEADVILLLFDVTRLQTMHHIKSYWAPLLIELLAPPNLNSLPQKIQSRFNYHFNKTILLIGTKTDLMIESLDTEYLDGLMKEFSFLYDLYLCSASRLDNVANVFDRAQTYACCPVFPIYDYCAEEITPLCSKALLRIFRIIDRDGDNLLSDKEIEGFQNRCFQTDLDPKDILEIKAILQEKCPAGVYNQRITFEGFIALIGLRIADDPTYPWAILRNFNYDDDLALIIPPEINKLPDLKPNQSTELSDHAQQFLLHLANTAYNENARPINNDSDSGSELENCLTSQALSTIFSVLPSNVQHPWLSPPAYRSYWPFSLSNNHPVFTDVSYYIEQSILLPGLEHIGALLTLEAWITHWHFLAASDPLLVQKLLFYLGYENYLDLGIVVSLGSLLNMFEEEEERKGSFFEMSLPEKFEFKPSFSHDILKSDITRRLIRIAIVGDASVGKSSFVWSMSGLPPPGSIQAEQLERGAEYKKTPETMISGGLNGLQKIDLRVPKKANSVNSLKTVFSGLQNNPPASGTLFSTINSTLEPILPFLSNMFANQNSTSNAPPSSSSLSNYSIINPKDFYLNNQYVYLHFKSIPLEHIEEWAAEEINRADIIIFMFQVYDPQSLETVMQLEKTLPIERIPRLFVVNKYDLIRGNKYGINVSWRLSTSEDDFYSWERMIERINLHIKEHDLPPLLYTSIRDQTGFQETITAINSLIVNPPLGIPVANRNKKSQSLTIERFIFPSILVLSCVTIFHFKKEISLFLHNMLETIKSSFESSNFLKTISSFPPIK